MTPYTFDPPFHFRTIVLVGLGGTGSHWARGLARCLYAMRSRQLHLPEVLFVDPDTVEERNVARQMFTEAEIGHNKAVILARRFNQTLGLSIAARPEPFNAHDFRSTYGLLLCGAVDNHLARLEMARVQDAVWLDSGNSSDHGQVVIGSSGDPVAIRRQFDQLPADRPALRLLPHAGLLFPALLAPEPDATPQSDLSCADLVLADQQDLFINDWQAIVAMRYTQQLLLRKPIQTFLTFIDSAGIGIRSLPITRDNLNAYLPENAHA